jgi:hypothetical protein
MDLQKLIDKTNSMKENFSELKNTEKTSYKVKAYASKMEQFYSEIGYCLNQLLNKPKTEAHES